MGNPGDSLTFTRYFVVGDGTVSSITDARNEIQCLPTGTLEGTVTAGGSPAARADVAVLGDALDGPTILGGNYLQRNVITHTRTDDSGNYSLTLPVGDYTVAANLDGWPYEGGTSTPTEHPVTIDAFLTTSQNLALPATGGLHVTIEDENNDPIAGKVSVVGFDPSPDPLNAQSILGLISNNTGVFGDRSKDGLPFGLASTIFVGPNGDSGVQPLEPGDYQVVVSHGAEFSVSKTGVTVAADPAPPVAVAAQVDRVIDSTGFVSADFHVHSINSPDSEVSKTERLVSMLAEGMDFFTPTDHDFLTDYQPTIDDLGASDLISVATGEEITTFDYGHFNAWPLTIDPSQVNGGGVDHGGAAPAGQDFPMFGNYSKTPAEIIALARTMPQPGATTVQINHIHSHFGLDGGSGLAIDTGVAPAAVRRAGRGAPPRSVGHQLLHRHLRRSRDLDRRQPPADLRQLPRRGDHRQRRQHRRLVQHAQSGHHPHRSRRLRHAQAHHQPVRCSPQHGRLPGGRPGPARPPRLDAVVHRQRRPYHRHQRPHGARDGVRVVHRRERRPRPGPLHRRRRLHGRRRLPALHGQRAVRRRRKLHGAAADDRDHGRQRRHRSRHSEPRVGGVRHRRVLRQPHHDAPHLDEQADRRRPDQRQSVRDHAGLREDGAGRTSPSHPLR